MPADVVLIHGQPGSLAYWLGVRQRLPGLRVLVPDRPGYGTNPEPATDYPGNVSWLLRYLDRRGVDRAVLVAHSWAGGVALLTAARHPDRVAALVLVSSVGPRSVLPQDHPLGWPVVGEVFAFAALRTGFPLFAGRARRLATRHLPPDEQTYVHMAMAAQRRRPAWRSFLLEQRAMLRQIDMVEATLDRIGVPTRVLTGTRDPIVPVRTAELLARRIPGATLHRVEGGGHELPLQDPASVAETIWTVVA